MAAGQPSPLSFVVGVARPQQEASDSRDANTVDDDTGDASSVRKRLKKTHRFTV
jgi:hypothetical protein